MKKRGYRVERDSLGEVRVPEEALYGAQTQRALENFPISGITFPRAFLRALGLIKWAAARANMEAGILDRETGRAVEAAAMDVAEGKWDAQFPLDVYQTGSGTSVNMNANEVIAALASRALGRPVHPNDQVNMSQSSNDVVPSAIHVSSALSLEEKLVPSLDFLEEVLEKKASRLMDVIKTGRTHLMDALPLRMGREIEAWAHQVRLSADRVRDVRPRLFQLVLGGTAVGTGLNAPPGFGERASALLAEATGIPFRKADNLYAGIAGQETVLELGSQLGVLAAALAKICNDLRWMNSGPLAGLSEISLPALQPGSSIMPGKVNPVIPEAAAMACARVTGNVTTLALAAQSGNFQLNVMLPLAAHVLLESLTLLSNSARLLAEKAVRGFTVNRKRLASLLDKNPVLATALNPILGYEKAAELAKKALREGKTILDAAAGETDIPREKLEDLLDPGKIAGP
ncbi:MAG TPA: class II fumarate hydratase [Planctomycetes bacterium]|nr:class II fumarate hydratase [Planctomycetota bacterium]